MTECGLFFLKGSMKKYLRSHNKTSDFYESNIIIKPAEINIIFLYKQYFSEF